MDAVQQANAGHPGTAMALAPLAYLIYTRHLRHNPADPNWPDRDRFVLSAGHACILQYAALHLTGYDLPLAQLERFRQWGSITPGHPEHGLTPGIETTTGPLGQGFANGVGFALAERFLAERYNRPHHAVVDHHVYAICSDGDLMEGVSNEAASLAGQNGLGKLVYFYDDNRITIDGTTSVSFTAEDRGARLEAQGWHVQHVEDANDLAVARRCDRGGEGGDRATVADRRPQPHRLSGPARDGHGQGARRPARRRGGGRGEGGDGPRIPSSASTSGRGVRAHEPGRARRGASARVGRPARRRGAPRSPTSRADWDQVHSGRPRKGWIEALPEFPAGEDVATRDAGKAVMQALKLFTPTMVGGSADLVESTKTEFVGGGLFSATHAGRNIAFGIREHAMGSIVNGISLHNGMLKPYGATFFVFSDYMRPAVRLSALGHYPVVWVWTHDSIGVGEDGPTHQPVEHLMSLRALPNLWMVRPGDANETAVAWKVAIEREGGPVALALSRQKLPTLDRSEVAPAAGLEKGAYTLWESGPPDVILIASGSEVSLALDAGRKLAAENGTAVRVVSMPCWELFEAQPESYRDEVLPPSVKARLSVEAGVSFGWERWVGPEGDSVAVDRFGASAPAGTIFEHLGFTVDNVVARAAALLERVA